MKKKYSSIVFYFPYHDASGVPVLFLRLAEAIKGDYDVYLGDYSNGYMASNLPDGVRLISIDDEPTFPADSVFVFQSFLPWRFPFLSQVSVDSKILFWNLHPENFDPRIFNYHHHKPLISHISKIINIVDLWRQKKLQKILEYLENRKAILFMDRENVSSTERFLKIKINSPQFLPVPIPSSIYHKQVPIFPKTIEYAWVGRICDFKYRILEHTIIRLARASKQIGPSRLTIIGNGEYREYIEDIASSQRKRDFDILFAGEIAMYDLPKYLVENIDILFAMGTSALEAARVGIPVFLTDYSYKKINNNYRFKHLFDNTGYCLGEEITNNHYEDKSSLENSIRAVINNYPKYADLSYKYWASNFSIESAKKQLLSAVEATDATFGEMADLGFFESDFWGHALRSSSFYLRKDLPKGAVGFRQDC